MAQSNVEAIDSTVQQTNIWLKEIAEELHTESRHEAYQALRAYLQSLRDQLTTDEAAHLSAQLPLLVRGVYYEGWNPSSPAKVRDPQAFLDLVRQKLPGVPDFEAPRYLAAAAKVVRRHVTTGEMDDVMDMLPKHVRELLKV